MTEGLADRTNRPTDALVRLYGMWSTSGCGLQLTGNIQVDRRYLERPGNVAIDNNDPLPMLQAVAAAGCTDRCVLWAQLSHAGRQVSAAVWPRPVGPSEADLGGGLQSVFPVPRELTVDEILDIIQRFATAAALAKNAGFAGVQIHAAHGYLLSSFLSPLANRRSDDWGGSLENRARMLLSTVTVVRGAVGDRFPVAVKLNVSDFEPDGFAFDDCCQVAAWLADAGIDLLEISGGTGRRPAMTGSVSRPQLRSEGYFLHFARQLRQLLPIPLMVTGGFRSHGVAAAAIEEGDVDMVGMARPYVVEPSVARRLIDDDSAIISLGHHTTAWYYEQIHRLADGRELDLALDDRTAAGMVLLRDLRQARALTERASS